MRSARGLAESLFEGEEARGLFVGNAAHSLLPMEQGPSAAFGLVLVTLGHAAGWPFPKGGSQKIADALVSYLRSLGGEVHTGMRVRSVEEVPRARSVLFDVTARQLLEILVNTSRDVNGAPSDGTATAPGSSRSTSRSMVRSPGRQKGA